MRGKFVVVLAEAMDRLSRDREDIAGLFKRMAFGSVRIVTLSEGDVTHLHVGLRGTMNALFLKDLADKTRRGLRGRVSDGKSGGGLCFGYELGRAHCDLGEIGPRLTFTIEPEDENASQPIRVKVEIATRERIAYDGAKSFPFEIKNPWFNDKADIASFSREKILATKLRALLQRDKGRDLVDLAKAVALFDGLDAARIVELFGKYLGASSQAISRAEAEERMWAKLEDPSFLADVRPLLAADDAEDFDPEAERAAFVTVFSEFVKRIPGHAWAETPAMAKKFEIPELAST